MSPLTDEIMAKASPIPVKDIRKSPWCVDLGLSGIEYGLGCLGVKFGGVACLIVPQAAIFHAVREVKRLPENIGIGITGVHGGDGVEWMLVGPDGIAIWSDGA